MRAYSEDLRVKVLEAVDRGMDLGDHARRCGGMIRPLRLLPTGAMIMNTAVSTVVHAKDLVGAAQVLLHSGLREVEAGGYPGVNHLPLRSHLDGTAIWVADIPACTK